MAESEEELKSLLMKVKVESEKVIVTGSLLLKEKNVLKLREWYQAPHPQDVF